MTPSPDFNPKRAADAQSRYCDEHECPQFAPHSGNCYRCGRNIYLPTNGSNGSVLGITVDQAASRLITGCPHCNYSFVE